jgi:uncharacterized membrane protein YhfC
MVICAAVSAAVPVAAVVFFSKRARMNLSAIFLGLIMYVIFDSFLLNAFDAILMQQFSGDIYSFIYSTGTGYTLYYGFIHALFYSVGFYVAARMTMRDDTGYGGGVALGLGCGGANLIMSKAWPMLTNVIAANQINKNGVDSFIADNTADGIFSMKEALATLTDTPAVNFLIAGYDGILLFLVLVSLGVIIHLAATHRCSFSFIYLGMALFLVYQIFPAMYSVGLIGSVIIYEFLNTSVAAGIVVTTYYFTKKYGENPMRY